MSEKLPKIYYYNQGGRKLTLDPSHTKACFAKGFTKTNKDAPSYNPVYDKGKQPQVVRNSPTNISISMPVEAKGIERPLEVELI